MSDTLVDGRSERSRAAANWARMLALVAVALPPLAFVLCASALFVVRMRVRVATGCSGSQLSHLASLAAPSPFLVRTHPDSDLGF